MLSFGPWSTRIVVAAAIVFYPWQESVMAEDLDSSSDRWTPERMLRIKKIGGVQVSPDGKLAAFTVREAVLEDGRSEYRTHLHLSDREAGGSRQLTFGEKSCDDPHWSPDGEWLAFVSERSGTKNLWLIRPDGGEAQPLTSGRTPISGFKWSPDSRRIAFIASDAPTQEEEAAAQAKSDVRVVDQNLKRQRLYVVPLDFNDRPQEPKQLTFGDVSLGGDLFQPNNPPFDWSPDGQAIVFSHTSSPRPQDWTTADLSLVKVDRGEVTPLVQSAAAETSPCYSPDGEWIAYLASDEPPTWAGRKQIRVMPATGGPGKPLAETWDGFGRYAELLGWSADGQRLYYTETRRTSLRLMAMPLEGEPTELFNGSTTSQEPHGMCISGMFLNAQRTHVGFAWESLREPPEAHLISLQNKQIERISRIHEAVGPLPPRTELIRWPSPDGTEIEGFLTYPKDHHDGRRCPLLLVIHGGPMGVFTRTFDGSAASYPIAAFADRGYAVLRPNPRGSSGYGAKFRYANYGDWAGGDYHDLMSGVDHAIQLGIADADRLGIMGWSYGGYLTAWTITQTQRFKAASVGAGVTNLTSFTGTSDIPGFLPDYFHGEFWNDREIYRTRSPMAWIKHVRTPTLIQHGERDERVPLSQGQELYNALKRQGCTTQMAIYPRTPHGIEEPGLLLDCMQRNLDWFDRFLQPMAERDNPPQ